MDRRIVWLAIAACLVAALLWAWLGGGSVAPAASNVDRVAPPATGTSAAAAAAPAATVPVLDTVAVSRPASRHRHRGQVAKPAMPLPAADVPVAEFYDELKLRADSGEVAANCRLGTELARCAAFAVQRRQVAALLAKAADQAEGSARATDYLAEARRLERNIAPIADHCQGLPADAFDRPPWSYVYFAANRGDVPAILAFTVYPPMDVDHFTADIDGWKVYHEEAGRLLELAARKGSPVAMFQLAWAYANFPVAGGAPIEPFEPIKAIAWARAAQPYANAASARTLENLVAKMSARLDAGGLARARALAGQLRARLPIRVGFANGDFTDGSIPPPTACGR